MCVCVYGRPVLLKSIMNELASLSNKFRNLTANIYLKSTKQGFWCFARGWQNLADIFACERGCSSENLTKIGFTERKRFNIVLQQLLCKIKAAFFQLFQFNVFERS